MANPLGNLREFYEAHVQRHGAGLAGAACGLGWWAFTDALVTSPARVPFVLWLPGLTAMLALLLVNSVRHDEMQAIDPWSDEGVYWRSRAWLLAAYVVCIAAVVGAAAAMVRSGGGGVGLACVLQVACILGAALLFFVSRSEGEVVDGGGGGGGYSLF